MAVVGRIARAHGRLGQVIVNPDTDFPGERFHAGAELFVERDGDVRSLRVTSVRFHREPGLEWFGCTVIQMMSRPLLERLADRLERYSLYDAIQVPFAGTALEVLWGLVPAWLGYEKWFTDGFHRVRKHFVTYRREDDPAGMSRYINRYYRGIAAVAPRGDYLSLRALRLSHVRVRAQLNALYDAQDEELV